MKIQHIRNATLWLEYGGSTFLIDPMLSEQGANPPILNTENDRRNPLVPLPGAVEQWLSPNAILITHLHQDHWDVAAVSLLPHNLPLFCQEGDRDTLVEQGFENVSEIADKLTFQGVTITRTGGQHGTGEIGKLMGKVSGFVFQAENEPVVYLAGDTICCDEVKIALDAFKPEVTIVNAGGAQFLTGGHITMNEQDVVDLCEYASSTKLIAVHMDAINHCLVTRDKLKAHLEKEELQDRVQLPQDGEWCYV
ncbi:MBL fold metallo-hydrolase [Paenibacillus sp. FSL E2-8871]|uniref:MBL fold metallo-hydrolase n=1 Tax=Paenibacillus sp. FSL E2-8871 TaxID=2975326 RepID=UPI0030F90980